MMKDKDGIVQSSLVGLADMARVTEEECETALDIFLAPDEHDTSKVDEGRRLRVVPGIGWQVVNHEMYRFSKQAKRAVWREQKALQRESAKKKKVKPIEDPVAPMTEQQEREAREDAVFDEYPKSPNGEICPRCCRFLTQPNPQCPNHPK